MIKRDEGKSSEIAIKAFEMLVRMWPSDSRQWGHAMQAELTELSNSKERMFWLAGGIMALGKAWWNRIVYGRDSRSGETAVRKPGLLAAGALVAAAALICLVPNSREALRTVSQSWNRWRPATDEPALTRIAHEAEAKPDAKTLAFVSMRMPISEESARLADRAVSLDSSLTWIYSLRSLDQRYAMAGIPQTRGWAAKLKQWDPDNAVPYLVEAGLRTSDLDPIFVRRTRSADEAPDARAPERDPAWLASMQKAFAAPHYDSYRSRKIALEKEVLAAHGLQTTLAAAEGVFPYEAVNARPVAQYGKVLSARATEEQKRGDRKSAEATAWALARFAGRIQAGGETDLEKLVAADLLAGAYAQLGPIMASQGRPEEAALFFSQRNELERAARNDRLRRVMTFQTRNKTFSAAGGIVILHTAAVAAGFFGAATVLALFWLAVAAVVPAAHAGRVYHSACQWGRYAPMGLVGALLLLIVGYQPIARFTQEFSWSATEVISLTWLVSLELFWGAVLIGSVAAAALYLSRRFLRQRETS